VFFLFNSVRRLPIKAPRRNQSILNRKVTKVAKDTFASFVLFLFNPVRLFPPFPIFLFKPVRAQN